MPSFCRSFGSFALNSVHPGIPILCEPPVFAVTCMRGQVWHATCESSDAPDQIEGECDREIPSGKAV